MSVELFYSMHWTIKDSVEGSVIGKVSKEGLVSSG